MEPSQGENSVSKTPLFTKKKKREMANPVKTKAFLHPSTTAGRCYDAEHDTHPPPPVLPFLHNAMCGTDESKRG